MIEKIKKVLSNFNDISGWKITENIIESSELFFIRKELDMNRRKKVHHFNVTVYKDFVENEAKFKGSATVKIHPTMNESEIEDVIKDAIFSATFVKNEYYPLTKPTNVIQQEIKSNFSNKNLSDWIPLITSALFKFDNFDNGWINSAEIFLNKKYTRIINSEDLDVNYEGYDGAIEFITNWKDKGEEVELYRYLKFSNFDEDLISKNVNEMLLMSRDKAIAKPTPPLKQFTVLLTGDPVKEFIKYYYYQSCAQYVYEKISTAKIDENIHGKSIKGDLINMKLNPFMENSTESKPYDEDGYPLKPVTVFENGILKRYWGDIRYSYYLDIEPTGMIKNVVIDGGKNSIEELKKEPYLEIAAFSDFQIDPLTGDFGGEIRLGWYYDGKQIIPVTGGSISGNIKEIQREIYLSKELQHDNNFIGPKTIKLSNVNISGC